MLSILRLETVCHQLLRLRSVVALCRYFDVFSREDCAVASRVQPHRAHKLMCNNHLQDRPDRRARS